MRVVFGLLTAGLLARGGLCPHRREDWCGFVDKEYSQVRCGFSSRTECEQALGEKNKPPIACPTRTLARQRPRHRRPAGSLNRF